VVGTEKRRGPGDDVGDVLDTVKAYAKQETLGPLKGVGRSIGLGVAGVLCLGIGTILLLMAVLRVLQTELSAFDGNWSFVPYLIDVVLGGIVIAVAVSRIKRTGLEQGETPS
jgi:hypothetical protein